MGLAESFRARFGALLDTINALCGWRRYGVAALAGVAAASAMAPYYFLPLLAVGFCILVLLLDNVHRRSQRDWRSAFWTGWCFGFGYFLLSVYWMAFAFLVQAEQFAWMVPFVVLGMPAFLALFPALACAVAFLRWRDGPARIFLLAASYMVFEFARGHVLTGLPWNLPGQALLIHPAGAQGAAYLGVYGLSLISLLICLAPVATLYGPRREWQGLGVCLAGLGALFVLGAVRLALVPGEFYEDRGVRIVQANIPQREKIDPALWQRNFERHLALSTGLPGGGGRVYILWPENSASFVNERPYALAALERALPSQAVLLAGAVRRDLSEPTVRYFNSLSILAQTPEGRRAIGTYDKHHLVPFGEYLPLQGVLRAVGLAQLAPFEDGFTPGPGPQTVQLGDDFIAPMICYEAIFAGRVHDKDKRPNWIAMVTNDAWFGNSAGPLQHLDQARLRAIETGLPMARAANTGVSALIDARGVIVEQLDLYTAGRIDYFLPKPLSPTLYGHIGNIGFWILWMACMAIGVRFNLNSHR